MSKPSNTKQDPKFEVLSESGPPTMDPTDGSQPFPFSNSTEYLDDSLALPYSMQTSGRSTGLTVKDIQRLGGLERSTDNSETELSQSLTSSQEDQASSIYNGETSSTSLLPNLDDEASAMEAREILKKEKKHMFILR